MAANIAQRHRELVRQQHLQASFEKQRVELDAEIADIIQRYRQMKGMEEGKPAATASVEVPVKQ
jgi:hypothetical protein